MTTPNSIADAATQGEWHVPDHDSHTVRASLSGGSVWVADCRNERDAAYIAAISPATVKRLLAVAQAARDYIRSAGMTQRAIRLHALAAAVAELEATK
ncbi:MAG: hypothetical protein WC023_06275 [Rhodocyclaceae bacterium]